MTERVREGRKGRRQAGREEAGHVQTFHLTSLWHNFHCHLLSESADTFDRLELSPQQITDGPGEMEKGRWRRGGGGGEMEKGRWRRGGERREVEEGRWRRRGGEEEGEEGRGRRELALCHLSLHRG